MIEMMELMKCSKIELLSFLKSLDLPKQDDVYKKTIYERCKTDLDLFSYLFFPHYCTHENNQFHKDYDEISSIIVRGYRRAWAAPRGSAKSVKAVLIKSIHDACYGLEQFILIVSNTDPLAAQKLKDIRDEILSNDRLKDFYGIHFKTKKPGETAFIVHCQKFRTYFMAVGRGAQIRGVRFGPHRPTKIICDDLEHSEKVYSEKQREKTENYFREDIGKVGNEKTNIEVIGTILHRESLLSGLLKNPAYQSKKYQSIIQWPERKDLWDQWEKIYMNLQDNNRLESSNLYYQDHEAEMLQGSLVLWPEKEPLIHLMKEILEIGKRSFMKEKQNDPLGADDRVFENMYWYREVTGGIQIEETGEIIKWEVLINKCYGALDPCTGQSKVSKNKMPDFASIVTAYHEPKGRILIHHDWTKRKPPTQQIDQIFELHDKYQYEKFAVETNLYRELLLPNIIDEKKRREAKTNKIIRIPFYDIVNTENKDKRIHRLEPKVAHKWILFNRALSHEFINQFEEYPHGDHDDCPDCVEMIYNLIHNRYKVSGLSISANG
jgi:predicted phage terminase large subunit-like protein